MKRSSRVNKQTRSAVVMSSGHVRGYQTWIDSILALHPVRTILSLMGSKKILERIAIFLFLFGIISALASAVMRPAYNWDMVAYTASALEDTYQNPVDLHRETWRQVDRKASAQQQYMLKQSNDYNRHQWENPIDFQSQLSMYRVKVGYIALLKALDPYTGLIQAGVVLSVGPALIFGFVCLLWLWRAQALQGTFILLPLLFLADFLALSAAVTPDMLVSTLSLAALYCLHRNRDWSAALLLIASVFIRPDNFVLIIAFTIAAMLFGWRRLPMVVTFIASALLITVMSKSAGHPGWWPHFYFSTVHIQNSMINFDPSFSVLDFCIGYARGLFMSFEANDWAFLYILLLAAWALLFKAGRLSDGRSNALCFALAIGVIGKFVSFPLPDDRYYFMFIVGFMVVLIGAWKPQFQISQPAR